MTAQAPSSFVIESIISTAGLHAVLDSFRDGVLLVEAIALIGSPLEPLLDGCVLVDLPREERIARAVARGASQRDAVERDSAQAKHLAALRAASPVHIDGTGSLAHVAAAGAEAIAALCSQDGERANPAV